MRIILVVVWVFFAASAWTQQSSLKVEKEEKSYVFGQIFTDFRYAFNDSFKPQAAFNFNTGIIGFNHNWGDDLRGLILFDVTRTTHILDITDSLGHHLNYDYFEGSKYTAFLKMAEIRWTINPMFTFRVGQLLNTQYLTFQDRFWGYRYIDFTFQEKFRLGMPADFGVQLDFKYRDKLLNQFSVVNGEGPFRHQDISGRFLYSNNIQYYPTEQITLKVYVDYAPCPDTGENSTPKSVISGFFGYKTDRFRIGAEYAYVRNYAHIPDTDYSGYSFYGSVVLNEKFQALARYDHLRMDLFDGHPSTDYYIVGFQYEPVQYFTTALNFRYYSDGDLPFIYASFGLKF
jgi:hypothetical protein